MQRGSRGTILVSTLLLCSAGADAQDATALERGVALAEAADFELAHEALSEADALPLARPERVRLYATRAMVAFALARAEDARADLARLLVLGADASLPTTAPPELREELEALRRSGVRPPTVVARARIEDGVARVDARADGGADLVREVRIWVEDGEWRSFARVERPLEPDRGLRWYAEALGPGALRLATEGTREQPNVLRLQIEELVVRREAPHERGDDAALWAALGGGAAALLVGAAIAVGVALATAGDDGTQLSGPILE